MKNRMLPLLLILVLSLLLVPMSALAYVDSPNGDWSAKTIVLQNTSEAELMVRVGDIDALNEEYALEDGYNPFTAISQLSHGYPWEKDTTDPEGTDRIFVGSNWNGDSCDGYSGEFNNWKNNPGDEWLSSRAFADGAASITMSFDASGISVNNALLQICIDDFQAISWDSEFAVQLNGKDAPFVAELLNHVDQTGPTSYLISAIIPSGFYGDIASGKITITIDETTGCGDGYAVDFVKLLVNYRQDVFKGKFSGHTEPGATVRLLGTSTTVKASESGGFTFEAAPGLNVVRASKDGFVESYAFGIVISDRVERGEDDVLWEPELTLYEGQGHTDIDFTQFGATAAWGKASKWAQERLAQADALGLIPDCLREADLTQPINRQEFAAVGVKLYEALLGVTAEPVAVNPFTDCADIEVLKAYNVDLINGTSDTTFTPDKYLDRQEAATLLTRVYKKMALEGWTLRTDGDYKEAFRALFTMPEPFADDASIAGWARDSVYFMKARGIIDGVGDNMFAPKHGVSAEEAQTYGLATREQAIILAKQALDKLG